VYVQNPEGWTRKKIDLGLMSFTHATVRSGLQKGELVATQRPM
jgi:hypothetical protein